MREVVKWLRGERTMDRPEYRWLTKRLFLRLLRALALMPGEETSHGETSGG